MTHVIGEPAAWVSAVAIDDGLSVFDAATGTAMALNQTAADIFVLADGTTPVERVVSILATAYGVDPEAIAADVWAVVERLSAARVIVVAKP